jgi:Uma2 family endonuclease
MSLASYIHERIASNLIFFLRSLFQDEDNIDIMGGGLGVKTDNFEGSYFLPDVSLVKGKPDFEKNSTAIIKNPSVVFEVLSPSTKSYDLSEKLEEYKTFESIDQVIFVYQDKMKVTTYRRSYEPVGWLNQDFTKAGDTVEIEEKSLCLRDIYEKVNF